ncbi:hypothetical protein [Lactococcus protaetiae]|nr:hypothetical protein [Lactococcus protaetiae]
MTNEIKKFCQFNAITMSIELANKRLISIADKSVSILTELLFNKLEFCQ